MATDFVFERLKSIFANSPRIAAASFVGFAASEFLDINLYEKGVGLFRKTLRKQARVLWERGKNSLDNTDVLR
ncbi:MAG: VUT family protein [Treponema sp.]|nr:VUT family protein [Treponema sp.]